MTDNKTSSTARTINIGTSPFYEAYKKAKAERERKNKQADTTGTRHANRATNTSARQRR